MPKLNSSGQRLHPILAGGGLILFAYGLVIAVFYCFPMVQRMVSNADSLVMLDFSRDILLGQSIAHWNLPRVPYLFPDTLIGLVVMAFTWSSAYTLQVIAVLQFVVLVVVATVVISGVKESPKTPHNAPQNAPYNALHTSAHHLASISFLQFGLLIGLALFHIGIFFPVALSNLYWQIFASGAHFLMAIVVLTILYLSQRWQHTGRAHWLLCLLFFISAAETLSDSIAALLLAIWIGAQVITRLWTGYSNQTKVTASNMLDLIVVGVGVIVGTLASFLIPRQSLVQSFFSIDKLLDAALAYWAWLISSPLNLIFMMLLVVLVIAYPYLLAGVWPSVGFKVGPRAGIRGGSRAKTKEPTHTRAHYRMGLQSPVLWPSLGVMAATPFFFQEVGSIRYLAFPGLIALLSLALLYLRLWQAIRLTPIRKVFLVILFLLLLLLTLLWKIERNQLGPRMQDGSGKDLIGLAVGARADLALACLETAQAQVALEDGVATYWNARPTRFASDFKYYLAQINPWRPRSGYMMWGNNGLDFIYRNHHEKTPRQYNYLLATHTEIESRLWGSLPTQAAKAIDCPLHTVFYFEESNILWDYLFPLEVPFGFDRQASMAVATSNNNANSQLTTSAALRSTRIFPADDFMTLVGQRDQQRLGTTGKAGILAYGPYIPLLPGHYRLSAQGVLVSPSGAQAVLDVSAQFGRLVLASKSIDLPTSVQTQVQKQDQINVQAQAQVSGQLEPIGSLEFVIAQTTEEVEFRLHVPTDASGYLTQFELQRLTQD